MPRPLHIVVHKSAPRQFAAHHFWLFYKLNMPSRNFIRQLLVYPVKCYLEGGLCLHFLSHWVEKTVVEDFNELIKIMIS